MGRTNSLAVVVGLAESSRTPTMEKMMSRTSNVVATSARSSATVRVARAQRIRTTAVNKTVESFRRKFAAVERTLGVAGVQLMLALPALAEEEAKEPGKLFDFDYTLPIMAVQFLVLMVFLDKTWFTPVGKVLDDRDENLREKLSKVQDNTGDVQKYEDEAAKVVADARQEAANMIADAKKGAEKEGEASLEALKAKLEAQYQSAATALEKEEADARAALDPEIEKLAKQIVDKVA